jgi:hypothetical protein
MQDLSRCWLCGRTGEEVSAVFRVESTEDTELQKKASQIEWFRSKFNDAAMGWRKASPKEFKDMDFLFVVSNPDQFIAVKIIGEINDARRLMMDWLVKASSALRKGDEVALQSMSLSSLAKGERESILRLVDQFEGRWHRRLAKEEGEPKGANYPAGFQGVGLGDGLEFLIAGGVLYYDVQATLIQIARNAVANNQPKWGVKAFAVEGMGQVPACDVCAGLISGLRSAHVEEKAEPEPAKPVPAVVALKSGHRPEGKQEVTLIAPKRSKAQEATELPPGASPEFVDLIKKLGPSSEENAPKMHGLHEHRLKEDWDEMVENKSEES